MGVRYVYCHFSFRRPKNKDYGIFSAAIYTEYDGKRLVARKTRAYRLWENQQHVTAIQAYSNALDCIWCWQAQLIQHGVKNVMLVTDNSILAGWILDNGKNKAYTDYMRQAVRPYRYGGKKELQIEVGLCEVRDYEKSHKYCKEEFLENEIPTEENKPCRLDITGKNIFDTMAEDMPDGVDDIVPVGNDEE